MNKVTMFEKYSNLIRSKAWYYAKRTGVDYEEMEAQGYLIFCECLEKFDLSKSGFSTYLYIQLNRLNDFAKTYLRQKGTELSEDAQKVLKNPEENESQESLLQFAKENLSLDAYSLFSWIIERTWEDLGIRKPTFKIMAEYFGWEDKKLKKIYDECKNFYLVYC